MTGKTKPHYTDVLLPTAVRVWYRLHADGCRDLHPVQCAHDVIGMSPDWWEEDLETAVSLDRWANRTQIGGFTINQGWVHWALTHGVAPGQAFLVHIPEPIGSGEGDDYDEDWDYELLEIAPSSAAVTQRRWEQFLRKQQAYRELAMQSYQAGRHRLYSDTSAMYVRHSNYEPSGAAYGFPRGVTLSLCSARNEYVDYAGLHLDVWNMASGRDDKGDVDRAMAQLIAEACTRYPALSPQVIREMKVKH